jgi:hypothetical protein
MDELSPDEIEAMKAELPTELPPDQIVTAWWGLTIACAIDGDPGSRRLLGEATGNPDAWEHLAGIDTESDPPEKVFAEFLADVLRHPDHVDASRPGFEEAGWDPILSAVAEDCLRIARGIQVGRPEALPRREGQS